MGKYEWSKTVTRSDGTTIEVYDFAKVVTYNADTTMICTDGRGLGKTFGFREFVMQDAIKRQNTFMMIVRMANRIPYVMDNFFEKTLIESEYLRRLGHTFTFKTSRGSLLYQPKPWDADDKWKPNPKLWERLGYFSALSKYQDYKEQSNSYIGVNSVCFDEFQIEKPDRFNYYLSDEFTRFKSIFESCTRQQAGGLRKPHAYLLANTCSIVNPYFEHYGIDRMPGHGRSWHCGKTVLLDYVDDSDYVAEKQAATVSGRMGGSMIVRGADLSEYVARKPASATFSWGVVASGHSYGIWLGLNQGLYYVTQRVPEGANRPVYALTLEDMSINRIAASKAEPSVRSLYSLFQRNMLRFDSATTFERFRQDILSLYGLR